MSDTLRNRGLAGQALAATNIGLVRVEGPAVCFPPHPSVLAANIASVAQSVALVNELEVITRVEYDYGVTPIATTWYSSTPLGSTYCAIATGSFYGNITFADGTTGIGTRTIPADILAAGMLDLWVRCRVYPINAADTAWDVAVARAQPGDVTGPSLPWVQVSGAPAVIAGKRGLAPITSTQVGRSNIACPSASTTRYLSLATEIGGDPVILMTPDDIASVSPDSSSIPLSVGHPATIVRASTGPATAVVPDGTAYVNPATATAANTIMTDPAGGLLLNVTSTEDVVVGGVATVGNDDDSGAYPTSLGLSSASLGKFRYYRNPAAGNWATEARHDAQTAVYGNAAVAGQFPKYGRLVTFMILDRATNSRRIKTFDADLNVIPVSGALAMSPAAAITLTSTPFNLGAGIQSAEAAFFRKGVGIAAQYDDASLAALAQYLLNL